MMPCCGGNGESALGITQIPNRLGASVDTIYAELKEIMPQKSEGELRTLAVRARKENLVEAERIWKETLDSTGAAPNRLDPNGVASKGSALRQRTVQNHREAILVALSREPPTLFMQMWSFLKAKVPHLLGFRADRKVIASRRITCADCQFVKIDSKAPGVYCGACGCRPRPDSNLARKTTMRYAVCPQGLWK